MPGIVPVIGVADENTKRVGAVPDDDIPVYDTPSRNNVNATAFVLSCKNVSGEPANMQIAPGVALEHNATLPTPGSIAVTSNVTGAATPPVKFANPLIGTARAPVI